MKLEVKDYVKYLCALLGISADDNKALIYDMGAELNTLQDKVGFLGYCKENFVNHQFLNGYQKFLQLVKEWREIEKERLFFVAYQSQIEKYKSYIFNFCQKIEKYGHDIAYNGFKSKKLKEFTGAEKKDFLFCDSNLKSYGLFWSYPSALFTKLLDEKIKKFRTEFDNNNVKNKRVSYQTPRYNDYRAEFQALQNQIQIEVKRFGDNNQKSSTEGRGK